LIPKVKNIIEIVESFAPEKTAEEWDNSGLQVGDFNAEVTKIAVALDPVSNSVSRAIDGGANLLVTHHPLIFPQLNSINISRGVGCVIKLAINNSLSIYCAHTNFDKSYIGTNLALAEALGLTELSPLLHPDDPTSKDDFSVVVGKLNPPIKLIDFAGKVKDALNAPCVRFVGDDEAVVNTVGVTGGSGGDFIGRVATAGVDIFVTGEVRYHDALSVKNSISNENSSMNLLGLIEAGHFNTEEIAIPLLADNIAMQTSNMGFEVEVFVVEGEDPFSCI
jgi:dinuclear metal center YbgI/SA1388 family protein